jgi:hypothetical protein
MRHEGKRTSKLQRDRPGRSARRSARVVLALMSAAFVLPAAGSGCWESSARPGVETEDLVVFEQPGLLRVDIIILLDNGPGMSEEQTALAVRFPELINDLIAPPVDPGTGRPSHPPVEDLNIGIITPDMGTMGFPGVGCESIDFGDNGCFRSTPSPAVADCPATLPAFLSRDPTNAGTYTPARMAQDFTCLAMLGTGGCLIDQPLKAMGQAVATNAMVGGCNVAFLRPDSLVALVFVTIDDDCSVTPEHPEFFDVDRTDLGPMSLRCFLHPDMIEPVSQYVDAFRSLRPSADQDQIVLGMIVGVPPDAADCIGRGDEIVDCLNLPAMQQQIDPVNPVQLIPSCNTSMGLAFPPVRLVQTAQVFGERAYVDSICKADSMGAIRGITDRLVELIPSTCLPREPPFDAEACRSSCVLLETLSDDRACPSDPFCLPEWCPAAREEDALSAAPCVDPTTRTTCKPLKRDLGVVADGPLNHRRCLIRQAERIRSGGACLAPASDGWYYLPPDESVTGCPEVMFGYRAAGSLVEAGSTARFRCPR